LGGAEGWLRHRENASMSTVEIIIDPEFESLIPPLRADELAGLEASLKMEGCRDPLVVWAEEGILLDGHNRHRICRKQGIRARVHEAHFLTRDTAKLWVIRNQLHRRNLSDLDRIALAEQAEPLIEKKNADRMRAGVKADPSEEFTKGDTRDEAASLAGVSGPTYARGKAVLETGSPELVQAVRDKKASIYAASEVATLPKPEQREIVAKGEKEIIEAAKRIKAEKVEKQRGEREARRLADMEARAAAAKASASKAYNDRWCILPGDCVERFRQRRDGGMAKARLIFADPPYNIGVDYGDHYDDARSADDFERWCREWIIEAAGNLSDDGSFWLLVNHEWAWVLAGIATQDVGLHLNQWITWYESFGVNCSGKFNRCSRPLLWFTKDPKRFVFNEHAAEIRRESDRQAKYNDPRANPDGKLWDDVWGVNPPIPRLTGTSAERVPGFPTQLPLSLLRPIIAAASDPGDLVIDPFCGSGSTGAACLELGRKFLGFELSDDFAALAEKRLLATAPEVAA
jgi:DNA modification methylase